MLTWSSKVELRKLPCKACCISTSLTLNKKRCKGELLWNFCQNCSLLINTCHRMCSQRCTDASGHLLQTHEQKTKVGNKRRQDKSPSTSKIKRSFFYYMDSTNPLCLFFLDKVLLWTLFPCLLARWLMMESVKWGALFSKFAKIAACELVAEVLSGYHQQSRVTWLGHEIKRLMTTLDSPEFSKWPQQQLGAHWKIFHHITIFYKRFINWTQQFQHSYSTVVFDERKRGPSATAYCV